MPPIILKCQNPLEKVRRICTDSPIWCTEFASYVHKIFNFLAQNSDSPSNDALHLER